MEKKEQITNEADVVFTYKLIQHTPMIHFQYNEVGASLRASEVKPKLDRYLKVVEKEFLKDHTNFFLHGSESGKSYEDLTGLNYKMSFSCEDVEYVELGFQRNSTNEYDIYYGNMGGNIVKGVWLKKPQMTIVCFEAELENIIKKHIDDFFVVTNFGRMQDKGFGSFTIESNDQLSEKQIIALLKNYSGAAKCYKFRSNGTPFKQIKAIYALMKSGLNFGGYQRSLLTCYMHEKGYGNEKAFLKQNRMAPSNVGPNAGKADKNRTDENAVYTRALLGVGDHIDFILDLNNRNKKASVKIKSKEIERCSSPILFKVIDKTVYYVGMRVNSEIMGKAFTFDSAYSHSSGTLTVPQMPEDFIDDFLHYCFKNLAVKNETMPDNPTPILRKFRDTKDIKLEEVQ